MMYRGTTPEGKEVEGYYAKAEDYEGNKFHVIIPELARMSHETIHGGVFLPNMITGFKQVLPSSLAMSTGISDKNKVPIYGSFPVDGVMSEGGDDVKANDSEYFIGRVVWNYGAFIFDEGCSGLSGTEIRRWSTLEVIPKEQDEG